MVYTNSVRGQNSLNPGGRHTLAFCTKCDMLVMSCRRERAQLKLASVAYVFAWITWFLDEILKVETAALGSTNAIQWSLTNASLLTKKIIEIYKRMPSKQ